MWRPEIYFPYKIDIKEKLPQPQLEEYRLLFGTRLAELFKSIFLEVMKLKEDEVMIVAVTGSPGAGKSDLIARLLKYASNFISPDTVAQFNWEAFGEKAFRAAFSLENENYLFSDAELWNANLFLAEQFECFLKNIRGKSKLIVMELPVSSGYLPQGNFRLVLEHPDYWRGRLMGEVLLHRIVQKFYSNVRFRMMNLHGGPQLLLADIVRDQGAPFSVVQTHQSYGNVSAQDSVKAGKMWIPPYLWNILDENMRINIEINPLDSPQFRDMYGAEIHNTIDFIFPDLPEQRKFIYLRYLARQTAMAASRAWFMDYIIRTQYKRKNSEYSVSMVCPDVHSLGLAPEDAKEAFINAMLGNHK